MATRRPATRTGGRSSQTRSSRTSSSKTRSSRTRAPEKESRPGKKGKAKKKNNTPLFIGIGVGANIEVLKEFSPSREPLRLKGLNFKGFFEWLSQSVSVVSQSIPGDKVKLNVDNVSSWAEL